MLGYDEFLQASQYIKERIKSSPKIALILGSALGSIADEIEDPVVIKYEDIPHFLKSTVEGHKGELVVGKLNGKDVLCMSGRFHYYEGYSFEELAIPIRVFNLLGIKTVILTNAAGGVNLDFKTGDIMLIKDHIKLVEGSPLRGKNLDEMGPRFPDISNLYDREYQDIARKVSKEIDLDLKEGVYFYMPGPQFETPREIRAIRVLGGDAVGMSTVTESIVCGHCGIKVLAFSLISNMAAGIEKEVNHEMVQEVGRKASSKFKLLIREVIPYLD